MAHGDLDACSSLTYSAFMVCMLICPTHARVRHTSCRRETRKLSPGGGQDARQVSHFHEVRSVCREVAADLAARGAAVTLACRNVKAAHAAAADIRCCCAEISASRCCLWNAYI